MKKWAVLLSIFTLIGILGLTYVEAYEEIQVENIQGQVETIRIEDPFNRDEQVNKASEYASNTVVTTQAEDGSGYMSARRRGAITLLTIDLGTDRDICRKPLEKIERILKLQGLVEYIYDEKYILSERTHLDRLKPNETAQSVVRMKDYGDIKVKVGTQSGKTKKGKSVFSQTVTLFTIKDTLKDSIYRQLAEELLVEGYYVEDFFKGNSRDLLVLENESEMFGLTNEDINIDEKGKAIKEIKDSVRFAILAKEGKVEEIQVTISNTNALNFCTQDMNVLLNGAQKLGLDEDGIKLLQNTVEKTLAHPMKNADEKIGQWHYKAVYETTNRDSLRSYNLLKITLK